MFKYFAFRRDEEIFKGTVYNLNNSKNPKPLESWSTDYEKAENIIRM